MLKDIEILVCRSVIPKLDQEPAIETVARCVGDGLKELRSVEVKW